MLSGTPSIVDYPSLSPLPIVCQVHKPLRRVMLIGFADLKAFRSAVMMFLALLSLSPILRTLTAATSSDSIWALAAILFSLNAL